MNQVIQIGRIASDVEVKTTMSGVSVCSFSLAVRRKFPDASGEYLTDFHKCVAWRNTAEYLRKYAFKGQKIAIIGNLQNRSYDANDGTKRYVTEIVVDEVELQEFQKDENGGNAQNQQARPGGGNAQNQQAGAGGGNAGYAQTGFTEVTDDDELPF
jgi:single-strand DNA-binding protein